MTEQELRTLVGLFLNEWIGDLRARVGPDTVWLDRFLDPLSALDAEDVVATDAEPESHASLKHLDAAIDAIDIAGDLGVLAGKLARHAKWRGLYQGGGIPDALANGMSAARIAGPGALIESRDVLAGFFLLAPGVYYPKHDHEPEEIYQSISGSTAVSHGVDGEPLAIEKGAISFQATDVVHDLQVSDRPALILYLWTGNMGAPTWWWRQDEAGVWWRDCWERQSDLTLRMTRSQQANLDNR